METEKCFCHFNSYEVKDAKARNEIENIKNDVNNKHKILTSDELEMEEGYSYLNSGMSRSRIIEKYGKLVHVCLLLVGTDTNVFPDSLTRIARLPEGFRPKNTEVYVCGLSNTEWGITDIGYVSIGSDGYINVRNSCGELKNKAFINVSYFTN